MAYFSEREQGPKPRTVEHITEQAWGGIVSLIRSELERDAFGLDFPWECPDGGAVAGNDVENFRLRLAAEIPGVPWPLNPHTPPDTLDVLDLLEFCHHHIAAPEPTYHHSYMRHNHLNFDREVGQVAYRATVNRLLARSQIAFETGEDGDVVRIAVHAVVRQGRFVTGDATLDSLLNDAVTKYLDPDPAERANGLEKLWDAWERLKTVLPGKDKKESAKALLDRAATSAEMRAVLEGEARELTRIGNEFRIRHSETNKTELTELGHVDYLFERMLALIRLAVRGI
jgi:hypothetical protein